MKQKPKVSIIVLNWNGKEDTIECIDSIVQITYPNYEIILVDNASTDGSAQYFREYYKEIKIIENRENLGFAEGNNVGIREALKQKANYILLLNNDTIVDPSFLEHLIEVGESDDSIGILSPIIYYYDDRNKIQYCGEKVNWYKGKLTKINLVSKGVIQSEIICGASMLIKKETIEKIGLLPTEYFMLWEDIDYSIKALKNNIKNVYVTKSKIWHKGSVSIGGISSPFRMRYTIRNRIILWKKYSSKLQFCSFLINLVFLKIPIIFTIGLAKTNQKKTFINYFSKGLIEGLQAVFKNKL